MLSLLSKNLSNLPGWRTDKHLVVIESDDWGSIRMPSEEVFNYLENSGIDLTSDEGYRFNKYDTLATAHDLSRLYEVLRSVRDGSDRPAVITPMALVANPDFPKIRDSGFSEYHYEPFTETLAKYPGRENSFRMWGEGIAKRLFVPQFHGREHLNVNVWLKALQSGHKAALLAFDKNMWGITTAGDPDIMVEFQAAFDFIDPGDLENQREVIRSGLALFEDLFGYKATHFVPPNGPFSSILEADCTESGIKYLTTSKIHHEPIGYGKTRRRLNWLGKRSRAGMTLLTRNCFFEPSDIGIDWVDSCLADIYSAFRWRKPAIISSHRVNYIGAIDPRNRENGLEQLHQLLKRVVKNWPDVLFLTSAELGDLILNDKSIKKS